MTGTGAGVTVPAVGDDVFGLLRFDHDGAAAEYVTAPAEHLAAAPVAVSPVFAAAAPLAALTAWQALVDHAGVRPDDEIGLPSRARPGRLPERCVPPTAAL